MGRSSCKFTIPAQYPYLLVKYLNLIRIGTEREDSEVTRSSMKRYGNLFSKIVCKENIALALVNAGRGKGDYEEVIAATANKEETINLIHEMLLNKTYKCSLYTVFKKNDKGKERSIHKVPFFPDRIIQHAIVLVLGPIWNKSLITDTYQSIPGRGVHACLVKVKRAVQKKRIKYCLKLDIKSYYPSIDNAKLKIRLQQKVKCRETLELLGIIIDGAEGVPIGNYISQYFGNLYLSGIDHKIKNKLKIKDYYRYCDDLILLSNCKQTLWSAMGEIQEELHELSLELKRDHQLFKITEKRGVDCFGYTVTPTYTRVRRRISTSFSVKLNKMISTGDLNPSVIGSYFGWFKHADSAALWSSILKRTEACVKLPTSELNLINKFTDRLRIRHAHCRI